MPPTGRGGEGSCGVDTSCAAARPPPRPGPAPPEHGLAVAPSSGKVGGWGGDAGEGIPTLGSQPGSSSARFSPPPRRLRASGRNSEEQKERERRGKGDRQPRRGAQRLSTRSGARSLQERWGAEPQRPPSAPRGPTQGPRGRQARARRPSTARGQSHGHGHGTAPVRRFRRSGGEESRSRDGTRPNLTGMGGKGERGRQAGSPAGPPRPRASHAHGQTRAEGRERGALTGSGGAAPGAERRSLRSPPRRGSALPEGELHAGHSVWEQTLSERCKELSGKSLFNTSRSSKRPEGFRHFSCGSW